MVKLYSAPSVLKHAVMCHGMLTKSHSQNLKATQLVASIAFSVLTSQEAE